MSKFSVRKPFTVLVAVIIVFALGAVSFRSMKPELLPNIELPYIITVTTYPGASPEKVEAEVSRPLEQSFSTLENLESVQSQSRSNASVVILEFTDGANMDAATLDILQKVNQVQGAWDDIVGTPIILKMNPDMLPVMIAAVEQEGKETAALSRFMEDTLQNKLEGIDGVASLDVTGLRTEQVNVVLRQEKLDILNAKIADSIAAQFAEKEDELRTKQTELEDTLSQLEAQGEQIAAGADQLAQKIGQGATEISANWGRVLTGLEDQKALLAELKKQLDALIEQEEAARQQAGGVLPPLIQAQFDDAKAQLQAGIDQLEAGIAATEAAKGQLAAAQGQLDSASVSTLYKLSSGASQLSSAQSQLASALQQIEQGLAQLGTARDAAIEKADMGSALNMPTLSALLKAQNFSMPAGYVSQDGIDYLVRVGDEVQSLEEMQKLVLMDLGIDGIEPVRLADVADVFVSDNLEALYAKINGNDGILLSFNKQSERSTTEVTDAILAEFDRLEQQYPGMHFTTLMNQGDYIYTVLNSITSDLLWGALFAVVILLLFLRDLRPTFITLCAIPISLVFALVAMYFCGVTLNIISLSGLAIAVGRLVDDSVVVIENIFRLRAKGYSPIKAAVSGAGQVAGAIAASTLTTICVFFPIVFVQGLTRQLFTDFALTFAFALLASLAIALSLVPAMASGMFRKMEPKSHRLLDQAIAAYDRLLVWSLRFKPVVLALAAVLLGVSIWAVMSRGFAYMSEGNMGQLTVNMTMPQGTTADDFKKSADEASKRIMGLEGVETVGTMASGSGAGGSGSTGMLTMMSGGGSGASGSSRAAISYVLLDRSADAKRITADIESSLAGLEIEAKVSSSGLSASALGGSGITVNIYSDKVDDLISAARDISRKGEAVAGVLEVDSGLEEATPELRFTVDREKAAVYGLTTAQVYQQVASALSKSSSATEVTWDATNFSVAVVNSHSVDATLTPEYIKGLEFSVTKRDGTTALVKLADVATVTEGESLPTITRDDQRRYLAVNMEIAEGHNITLVTQQVEEELRKLSLPEGVSYEVTGENATIMESFNELGLMLLLGLLLVYLIMVAQFQSLKSPFIIMFTVPLAFTGGFLALLVTGQVLSVISLIGFAMLLGIIVSNGIVLVDYVNRLRREGAERVAAIREGAATRMRPILMTALATIFALIIMALGVGRGSEMMQPLAIVCIGGLVYGTFMTLFVIPIIYDLFNRRELRVVSEDDLVLIEE
ncbi:MAG: efflux RND transporter permease subunit [Coriobacteriaceae bacterium]|jgi:HAE1 family hydrophobic/amphiphilic exporter-1|nr:efflux RND transporter permease subunit [Coriobacteriaceae bacterium]